MICQQVYGSGESLDASDSADMNSDSGDFECNICFELAQDPIVTLCGHLYCWPCLYEWLQVHSRSHECPVCKALIEEHKLVPIYGRGKVSSDPRSRLRPGINIPKRPVGQRPQTAPAVNMDYLRHDEFDSRVGARFGNSTFSALAEAIPAFFNLHARHGFHDATVYGATTGVPYLFSGSFHGGYAHGFHHSNHLDGTKFFMKVLFLIVGFLLIVSLIS
ncbi:postreplication repair E3 ubiquitin-protein ligase RAD18 isoform X1 [Capsicum chacoense]|uniref:postreplication repair E3 ubiquitin-protein ligase RAD18 isoform X1 n=2 Tax=Capsicum annuum TaxID=4072 RepID=UPI0007BF139E|nr:postreplication repair E3 ubiquitin-protein ligase RAD18 isoform X1 [Capsicum annuum]XP_047251098.1 postreplication repair E3 ubiquitin-protein ligase RAD18 isoform X1 [Capsicum annuum]KAF3615470.1 E3 ubiquitin-protein ligase RNF5 [Capsicum annuum]KAF3660695.1 E3 ubiquitin-protein ligase RNF5 [Capsicum annuum]